MFLYTSDLFYSIIHFSSFWDRMLLCICKFSAGVGVSIFTFLWCRYVEPYCLIMLFMETSNAWDCEGRGRCKSSVLTTVLPCESSVENETTKSLKKSRGTTLNRCDWNIFSLCDSLPQSLKSTRSAQSHDAEDVEALTISRSRNLMFHRRHNRPEMG